MVFLLDLTYSVVFGAIALVFLKKIWGSAYSYFFWGAINIPTTEKRVEQMIGFLNLDSIKKAADLGSGDGRLVIALARAGVEAHGYEINPFLVLLARKNIKKAGLENKAFVYFKNFWLEDLGKFDAVIVYGMKHMMKKMEKKFEKELRPGTQIVSNYFALPTWHLDKENERIYLYVKKRQYIDK